MCLGDVEFRREAGFQAIGGEADGFLLVLDVVFREADSFFDGSDLDVVVGNFREDADKGIAVCFLDAFGRGIGGFDRTANTAKEINFPTGIDAGRPEIVGFPCWW